MNSLFFLDERLTGSILYLDEAIDGAEIPLHYDDDWYWIHYQLLDRSINGHVFEDSRVLRINLMNLFISLVDQPAAVKKALVSVKEGKVRLLLSPDVHEELKSIIRPLFERAQGESIETLYHECLQELTRMIAASRSSPICYWTYGDERSKAALDTVVHELGPIERIKNLLTLPHLVDLYHFTVDAEKLANLRYEAALKMVR